MTIHLSARIAWHADGWNGRVCHHPKANTYCVGQYSFPGEMIAERRDLDWEQDPKVAGQPVSKLNRVPPCIYSLNAFGPDTLQAFSDPPSWFRDSTQQKTWPLLGYTVATWPYEEMYKEEVENPKGTSPKYNPDKRREAARAFYEPLQNDHSLIFYYANYSNPFSENDQHNYVIIGVSRIKTVGQELTWVGQSPEMERKYGAYVWMRNITSHYPDQGLRLPYHAYLDKPEVLERILFVPENSRHFKYAARHISDDGALSLIERFREIVGVLQELGDASENWAARQTWLASIMAELWQHRGLYPGLVRVWDFLKFTDAIPYTMTQISSRGEQRVKDELFALVEGKQASVAGLQVSMAQLQAVQKQWRKLEPAQQAVLRDSLPRFDLQTDQIECLIQDPTSASIYASHTDIRDNPYYLAEQYIGSDPDDQITFSQIDHGMFPSPDLGMKPELEVDDWRRLRALCIEQLQQANQHTFLPADQVLNSVNYKLSFLPEWKRAQFNNRALEIDQDDLGKALTFRYEDSQLYLYRKTVFDDERVVENTLRDMAKWPTIKLRSPVTEGHWKGFLYDSASPLAQSHPGEYEAAIAEQVRVCQQIFLRPVSVLCGAAGTGKTTVVQSIIQAIEKGHGSGTSFRLLAPTGKAADRLRERTGKEAATAHSFLTRLGWLNDNLTFRRSGGKREDGFTTYIIDESSMLDLDMLAALFRAINWNSVQRLIFVGDPNQLPPIGTGKAFADLIDWLKREQPESIGELTTNMRQIQNKLTGQGTGIIDIASLYIRRDIAEKKSADLDAQEDETLQKLQEGGDITGDLRVLYWQTTDELEKVLVKTLVSDMERDTGTKLDPQKPYLLWDAAMKKKGDQAQYPEAIQVISPYRGELFGIEHLNMVLQQQKNTWWVENKGAVGGVTYFDKVIQIQNRPKSRPVWAWNTQTRKSEKIEVFNGEIGMTKIHGFDNDKWKWQGFHIERFQVVFSRKQNYWVDYSSESAVSENLELAYAISVHKSQGSEFQRVYFVLPKHKQGLLSRELFYTGITRAQTHCTLLVQEDISPILSLRRLEKSQLARINSSLFQFRPVPPEFQTMTEWYEEGKIHRTLSAQMVRSKSEVIIANILFERDIPFRYEIHLAAPDGTFYLPDFTINWRGEEWYWEHLGMLHNERYRNHWETKKAWYVKHGFAERLIETQEVDGFDSEQVVSILKEKLAIR